MDKKHKIERIDKEIHLIPENHKYTIIWLHGLGDSAEGFLSVFDKPKTRFVPSNFKVRLLTAPKAPITIYKGFWMNSWYDILETDRDSLKSDDKRTHNIEDVQKNTQYIIKCLDEELEILGGDSSRLYLGGFS